MISRLYARVFAALNGEVKKKRRMKKINYFAHRPATMAVALLFRIRCANPELRRILLHAVSVA